MSTTQRGTPRRSISVLLSLLVATVGLAGAVFVGLQGLDQLRADTPVQAETRGEPGCVTSAVFTGPDGVERSVDVTVYKANCLDRDPGEAITVYVDADDPATTAARRSWWWSALLTLVALGLGGVGLRGLALQAVAARRTPAT